MINSAYTKLMEIVHDYYVLKSSAHLSLWDQLVKATPREIEIRAKEISVIQKVAHQLMVSERVGELLDRLSSLEGLGREQISNIGRIRRYYNRLRRVDGRLVEEFERVKAISESRWEIAKASNDFSILAPVLERVISLGRERARQINPGRRAYDVLLGDYEDNFTMEEITGLFAEVEKNVSSLIWQARETDRTDVTFLKLRVPRRKQLSLNKRLAARMGFDFKKGIIDTSAHPFSLYFRIATKFSGGWWSGIRSTMHETGHVLWVQGLPEDFHWTPMAEISSMSLDEGLALLWENHVGLSPEFSRFFLPWVKKAYAPYLDEIELDKFYGAINGVRPNFIRIDADELSYPLHVILRTNLERMLIEGELSVQELPGRWNEETRKYLGITPPTDREGVLQDPHWAAGLFGYFPSYALGAMLAAQIFESVKRERPNLMGQLERGSFRSLKKWLDENVHRHGGGFETRELIEIVTGKPPGPEDYIWYLKSKYSSLS